MKNWFFIAGLFFILIGCEEEAPFINLQPEVNDTGLVDTSYISPTDTVPQTKNILISDYTGVKCPNCPKAAEIAKEISEKYPGRVIVYGIHANAIFGSPYPESKEDYRTEDGEALYDFFGRAPQPAGDIDRVLFPGENTIMAPYTKWKQYADRRIKVNNPLNLYLSSTYDSVTNEAIVRVKVWYLQEMQETHFLSLAVLQNNIIDYQIDITEKLPNYEHDHVLRDFITPYSGSPLIQNPEKNRVIIKEFRVNLNNLETDLWVREDMTVSAFVHNHIDSFTVKQVQEISFIGE